ncbi:MAG: hypothetical protein ABI321_18055 [Polyangia bacterium]
MRAVTSLVLSFCVAAALSGCKEDPAIVIRFDPPDLAGRKTDAAVAVVAPTPADAECEKDADCTIEVDGCCDCANGGKQKAVSLKHHKVAPSEPCDSVCTMMMSTDPSCSKRPVCVEGACTMREARPGEVKPKVVRRKKPTP